MTEHAYGLYTVWINNVVCCKKCKVPMQITFFHDGDVLYCPKCYNMDGLRR